MRDAYTNASYWKAVVTQINSQRAGTVDGVHLQAYTGGAGNNPCSGWDFGGVPVYPGIGDSAIVGDTVPSAQIKIAGWEGQCDYRRLPWLYDDVSRKTYSGKPLSAAYAGRLKLG